MVKGLFALAAFQLAGEALARALNLPVPGPVLGLVALIAGVLALGTRVPIEPFVSRNAPLSRAADGILSALGLLFVPAGVGIMQHGALLLQRGPALLLVLVVSTLATLMVTVGVFLAVSRLQRGPQP